MARKKTAAPAKQEVSRQEINGNIIITYDDGTVTIIPAPIELTKEQAEAIFGSEEADEEDEDEDEDSDEDEEDDDLTPEALMGMDFEELEDLCDDKDLDTDPDDYDEDDIESFRKEVAKELGITLPKAKKSKKSKK